MHNNPINPDLAVGQVVWVEGRPHPTKKDWCDAYGKIADIVYDDDEPVEVIVEFEETETVEIYKAYRFDSWNDRNDSWSLFKED